VKACRFTALVGAVAVAAAAPANADGRVHDDSDTAQVGHRVETLDVLGSAQGELRQLRVHLWYPADKRAYRRAAGTVYRSRLHGQALLPDGRWDPLSWSVNAQIARDTDEVDGKRLPAIVFSHGSTNDPIDYAHTLEALAGEGFVVAAPYHVNNTQDDVRVDFINGQIFPVTGQRPFACEDGLMIPCSHGDLARSMQDRVSDIGAIIDALPGWLGKHADAARVGVLGHSRGTVTALAAGGGSTVWGFEPGATLKTKLKAIMGMAIGGRAVTIAADLGDVTVPTVLVSGLKDANSTPDVSETAFGAISSADKLIVRLPGATHRSFDSTYCAQLQSAATAFDTDGSRMIEDAELTNSRPILDRHTFNLIAASPPQFLSGKAVHYCAREFFTRPVNIERLVAATPNAEYACQPAPATGKPACAAAPALSGPPSACEPGLTGPPCTGLDTGEVSDGITRMAKAFFASALKRKAGVRFSRWLSPAWLVDHVRMVGSAEAFAGPDSMCRPHSGVTCTD
jgi:predicted dienelactone hydrolase